MHLAAELDAQRLAGDRIQVSPIALSDRSGTATLRVPRHRRGGFSNQGASLSDVKVADDFMGVEIEAKRLDDLGLSDTGFIKIDVEGHEFQALAGLGSLRQLGVRYVVAEFFPSLIRANGRRPGEILELLAREGFSVVASRFRGRNMAPVPPALFADFTAETSASNQHADIFCHRDGSR